MKPNNNSGKINLPSREECIELVKKHADTDNVFRHSLAVNKLAVFIAKRLKEKGIAVNIDLVDRASLLHDLDKIKTLSQGHLHGEMSSKMLDEMDYPEIAEIVKNHHSTALKDINKFNWETRIVNYSDKRCQVDKIVSLDERYEYGIKKYPDKVTLEQKELCIKLEKEIFSIIGINPDEVGMMV